VPATAINHTSIAAHDLEESVAFYRDVFGMEPLPTPNFEVPVQWLDCGAEQLHLFERQVEAPEYHHLGLTVDDFEEVYRTAEQRDLFAGWDDNAEGSLYLLPDDAVQMYINDPAGNLIEIDHPDVDTLEESVRAEIVNREDLQSQSGEAARASLMLRS
jgi:lactoylglutathione lyase